MHQQRKPRARNMRNRQFQIRAIDLRKPIASRIDQETLEPRDAFERERLELLLIAVHRSAPQRVIHHRLAARRLALQFQRSHIRRLGQAVQWHVDDRREPASRGRARSCRKALPLRAARLVQVRMHIHKARNQRNSPRSSTGVLGGNLTRTLHSDDTFAFDEHDRIALAVGRHNVSGPETVYHDADYARFHNVGRGNWMSDAQPQFMQQAIALATENVVSGRGGPFGAVIVKDGQVLATGVNHVTQWNDPTAHAEVVAIREACKKLGTFWLKGCDVYTSCEPCPMCLAAIYWSHCRAIYYGNSAADAAKIGFDDSFLYDEMRKPLDQRKIPIQNMLAEKAWESFAAWEASPNKIEY